MRRTKLEGIILAKRQLDLECAFGGYTPPSFKKFEVKEGKTRLIHSPTSTEILPRAANNYRRKPTMMVDSYDVMRMREAAAPPEPSSLRTGEGHGHFREFDRERPKKDDWARKRKRAKMSKASRKRNRR